MDQSQVTLSILICTRDRLPKLKNTVRDVGKLQLPEGTEAELVVVDNGSTDDTTAWVEQTTLPKMPVRLVEETRTGVGHARTAALYASNGDILLFTDDDVRIPPDWATELCKPILRDKADVVGGTAKLTEHLRHPWMNRFHRATLSSIERKNSEGILLPITISMAFRRAVIDRVPAFDPELGPGSLLGCCEDTLFVWQLREAEFQFTEVDTVPVVHHPSEDRLTRSSFLRAARARGRSMAYIRYHWLHWGEWAFTNRTAWYEFWRHPYLVVAKRWVHLILWQLLHPDALAEEKGIQHREFSLVNLFHQALQYLTERTRPRNYEERGLRKIRGERPDKYASERSLDKK